MSLPWKILRAVVCLLALAIALAPSAAIMFLQVWYHLIPQLHHNDNYMETYRYVTRIVPYNGTCTRDVRCGRYSTCPRETFPCSRWNRTWEYTVGSGVNRGGRNITIPTRTYHFYDDTPDPAVVTQFEAGPVRQVGYYDPHDPWNLWDSLDTSHRDWAITTTAFLTIGCIEVALFPVAGVLEWFYQPQPPPPRPVRKRPAQSGRARLRTAALAQVEFAVVPPALPILSRVLVIPSAPEPILVGSELPQAPGGPHLSRDDEPDAVPLSQPHVLPPAVVAQNIAYFG